MLDWTGIHPDFTPELKREWKEKGFSAEKCKEWIDVGLSINDADYAWWLEYIKDKDVKWFLNYEKEKELREEFKNSKLSKEAIEQIKKIDYLNLTSKQEQLIKELIPNEELRERYKKCGLCETCRQPNTSRGYYTKEPWCQSCNSQHFAQDFDKWTSGNLEVDDFIKKYQLRATNRWEVLEWIPYEQFTNIEFLAEGGFGKVYKAKWIDGNIQNWNIKNNEWQRDKYTEEVALKILNNSQRITNFLYEVSHHKLIDNQSHILRCYGVSQDPNTGNYIMIMRYAHSGNMRQHLKRNYNKIEFEVRLKQLNDIAQGLKAIHEKGLAHRDFHAGNILNNGSKACFIADLGLCKPANEQGDTKLFGVLPYVAPEVLQNQPYTQSSDIYSFGIVAYELLANAYPYTNLKLEGIDLALAVCRGLRPSIDKVPVPQILRDLIKKCWDDDPQKRPNAEELHDIVWSLYVEIRDKKNDTGFYQQYQEIRDEYNTFSQNTPYRIHPIAVTTSKLINTKQITQLLQRKNNEHFGGSKNLELDLNNFNLDELNIQEESSIQAQQEIPFKGNN